MYSVQLNSKKKSCGRILLFLSTAILLTSCQRTVLENRASKTIEPQALESPASLGDPRIVLRWKTETESNTFGYYVYRGESESDLKVINAEEPIHALGNTTTPQQYVYFDLDVEEGKTYFYKLQSRDLDGSTEWIVGGDAPVKATPKPLTAAEFEELQTKGKAYRQEAG